MDFPLLGVTSDGGALERSGGSEGAGLGSEAALPAPCCPLFDLVLAQHVRVSEFLH